MTWYYAASRVRRIILLSGYIRGQRKACLNLKGCAYVKEGNYDAALQCFLNSQNVGFRIPGMLKSGFHIGRMFFEGKGVNEVWASRNMVSQSYYNIV